MHLSLFVAIISLTVVKSVPQSLDNWNLPEPAVLSNELNGWNNPRVGDSSQAPQVPQELLQSNPVELASQIGNNNPADYQIANTDSSSLNIYTEERPTQCSEGNSQVDGIQAQKRGQCSAPQKVQDPAAVPQKGEPAVEAIPPEDICKSGLRPLCCTGREVQTSSDRPNPDGGWAREGCTYCMFTFLSDFS